MAAVTPVVLYRPFDGRDGLDQSGAQLKAYAQGQLVAEAESEHSLAELLSSHRLPEFFPQLNFAYSETHVHELLLSTDFTQPGHIYGSLRWQEQRYLWNAARVGHDDFLRQDELPAGVRRWAQDDERGRGWELILPQEIIRAPDPVFVRRTALAVEAMIYAQFAGRELPQPYRRSVNTVFSVGEPHWNVNLPRIVSNYERQLRDRI